MIIAFLDNKPFNGHTTRVSATGGIEHATVGLSEALARAGHRVCVYNLTPQEMEINGVRWLRLESANHVEADAVIANNNVPLLDKVSGGRKIVWFHNPLKLHRMLKKGDLLPIYRHRPHAIFLSKYHQSTASRLLPFASRTIIGHAHSPEFVRPATASAAPAPRAVFISQTYRGLDWTLDVWARLIRPVVPGAEFHLFTTQRRDIDFDKYGASGVVRRGRIPRGELAQELMAARLMLYPGHRDETYCFAACEATAAGLPIVSRGIGALAERVQHGRNGYIAYEGTEFAQYAAHLLADDDSWLAMHATTMSCRDLQTWDDRVGQWSEVFAAQNAQQSQDGLMADG